MKAGTVASLALLVAVVALSSVAVHRHHLVSLPPFHADEAGHALPAAHDVPLHRLEHALLDGRHDAQLERYARAARDRVAALERGGDRRRAEHARDQQPDE